MAKSKTITQETFDAVVRENIDEFSMEVEDGVNDAVQQFKAQNVDLYNIVKQVELNAENLPVMPSERAKSLIAALSSEYTDESSTPDPLNLIKSECDKDLAHRCLFGNYGAADCLMKLLAKDTPQTNRRLKKVLISLISLTNGQPDILKADYLRALLQLGRDFVEIGDVTVVGSILKILLNCCIKHEANRQTLVDAGVIELVMDVMDKHKETRELIVGSCSLLRALTLDDDVRVVFGRAHENAKLVVTNHSAIQVLLNLAKVEQQSVEILTEVITTLACLAVRNEFCQEVNDHGGLQLIFTSVMENIENMSLVKGSFGLLKTLAGNDMVKEEIVKAGGVKLILEAMNKYQKERKVCEAGCACFAALALRSTSNCQAIIDAGGAMSIITAMKVHKDEALVQKLACRAVRDLISRCRQFCPVFLDNGIEDLIRTAAIRHSVQVADEAKAALRDLGCKVELQELWTGKKGSIAQE